ncbi:MAG TPA: 4'-phosphopantetheinyl transferase superfamily protein [Chitinispirillaceae bacterium]|nr:4'-phosphopantetheinyl transferase superfamily protein [Chitinispirillaceae bacterium]
MRLTVRLLSDVIEFWSQKYSLSGAIVELPEIYKDIERYTQYFKDQELESLNRISNRKRKASRIAGRIAVRNALRRFDPEYFYDAVQGQVEILNDEQGKPYLTKHSDINISITHSGAYALAVVSKKRIGIDIERIENRPDCFINTYFCSSEQKWIRIAGGDSNRMANYLWTRKEAVSKLLGVGGTILFSSIPVLENESDFIFESHHLHQYCLSLALQKEITA